MKLDAEQVFRSLQQADTSLEQVLLSLSDGRRRVLAASLASYVDPTTGDTALHALARCKQPGSLQLCQLLCSRGATVGAQNNAGDTPLQVAEAHSHTELVQHLAAQQEHAAQPTPPPSSKQLLPSSCQWTPNQRRTAHSTLQVSYGGGVVTIPAGSNYWADAAGHVLVGWHGTYDPPCDMDGGSMVS